MHCLSKDFIKFSTLLAQIHGKCKDSNVYSILLDCQVFACINSLHKFVANAKILVYFEFFFTTNALSLKRFYLIFNLICTNALPKQRFY